MTRAAWVSGIDRLLAQRARAEQELASDGDPTSELAGHAVAAIVLAAASFEAHVDEWLAHPANRVFFTADELDALRWKPGYKIALAILRKRNAEKSPSSEGWYRRLRGLYQLRHHVAHLSPQPAGGGEGRRRRSGPGIEDAAGAAGGGGGGAGPGAQGREGGGLPRQGEGVVQVRG